MLSAEVFLWGTRIGAVIDVDNRIQFSYDPNFLESGIELSPINMPLGSQVFSFPNLDNVKPFFGLPGLLSDSLPDGFGNYLIKRYLERNGNGRIDLTPVEKLCYMGTRGMGALEYKPAQGPKEINDSIDIQELTELAEDVLRNKENESYKASNDSIETLFQVGSSAGGARAKAIIAWNEETNDIKSGQIKAGEGYGYWILKFGEITNNKDREFKPDDIDSTKTEYAYYKMALASGIEMSESRLFFDGRDTHFLTRRFDRMANGDKIHMHSLCGLTHLDFAPKSAYDYSILTQVFPYLELGNNDFEKIFRRMVFNDMAFNYDDHIKNISFLMDKDGIWKLSPAYDVTFAHDPNGKYTDVHQMRINGKNRDVSIEDYIVVGKQFGLKPSTINSVIEQVRNGVSRFSEFANEAKVRESQIEYIDSLIRLKLK